MESEYSCRTIKYLSRHSKEERSLREEFFTKYSIIYDIFLETRKYIPKKDGICVLEPSSGTGQFVECILLFLRCRTL